MVKWSVPDIGEEEADAVREAVAEGWISGFGQRVKKFEEEVRKLLGVKHAIAVCNGTCGLISMFLAYKYLVCRPIKFAVPTWTFLATASTADLVGKVEFIDVYRDTFTMLPPEKSDADVLVPVDAGGLPAEYYPLQKLNKPILADSAESLGAIYCGQKIGSIADATMFSLFSSKVITTGEGGIVTTNKDNLARLIRLITNQGYSDPQSYWHELKGFNFRMTEMQAAIGLVQLRKLGKYIKHRRELASIYKDIIGELATYQFEADDKKSTYYLFTILIEKDKRAKVVSHLKANDVPLRFWTPMHMQPVFPPYKGLYNANYIYNRHIHLPIHNRMSEEETKYVAELVRDALK